MVIFVEISWADGNNKCKNDQLNKNSNRNYTGKLRCLRESQAMTCAQLGVRLKMKDMCFLRRTTIGLKTNYKRKYIGNIQLHYPNSIKTFKFIAVCGDVELNPGPGKETIRTNTNTKEKKQRCKYPSGDCLKPVRNNQNAILCTEYTQCYHIWCTSISSKLFLSYYLIHHEENWCCPSCALPKLSECFLMIWSRLSTDRNQRQIQITQILRIFDDIHDHIVNEYIDFEENYLKIFSKNMKSSQSILNIGQLKLCSLSGIPFKLQSCRTDDVIDHSCCALLWGKNTSSM